MKVLSTEQMSRLKELGVDVSKASMHYVYMPTARSIFNETDELESEPTLLISQPNMQHKYPTFTLHDIIELLPAEIETEKHCYSLTFSKTVFSDICFNCYYFTETQDDSFSLINFYDGEIIEVAYQMLIWVIENGHLKTKTI